MRPTAVIADDEPALRRHLERLLGTLWPELEIVASVGDGSAAREAIDANEPDVAFLDIRMPAPDGLTLAAELAGRAAIVFVTAYDEHAVEAFAHAAQDYLVKPISEDRLQATVARLQARWNAPAPAAQADLLRALAETIRTPARYLTWLRVSQGDEVTLVAVDDVLFFRADRKYTSAVTASGEHLLRQSISELESNLDPERFWRIHRSTIVAVPAVRSARRDLSGRYRVRLHDSDEELTVSAAHAHRFRSG